MIESNPISAITSQPSASSAKPRFILRFCDAVIRGTLLVLTFLTPLFFLPWTVEVTEMNKQLLLFVGTGIATIAWFGKMLADRKFEYRRSVVNAIVVLFLAMYGISTWLSNNVYMSLVGDFGQEKAGFFTVLCFAALYFVASSTIQTEKALKQMLGAMMLSGFFAGLFGLLQGLGFYILPYDFARSASFNTVGTAASLGIYLAFIVSLGGGILLYGHGQEKLSKLDLVAKIFFAVTSVLALFIIAALDFWPVTVCLLVSSVLLIAYSFVHAKYMKGLGGILLPVAALIVSIMLLFFRFPLSLGYPAEVMPSLKASADITFKTLRDSPFFGSGPGTFIFDYAKYKSSDVNMTAFWNIRFDRGASRFFSLLATVGLLGTLSWLMVSLFLLGSAAKKLLKSDERTWHILIGMFSAWFLIVLSKFLYSSTFTLEFLFWIMMALLVVVHKHDFYSVRFERSPRAAMVVSFVFILGLVFSLSGLFVEGQRYSAEVSYAKAISADQAASNPDEVVNRLVAATNLNPRNDVYRRNLALALMAKAEKLLTSDMGLKKEDGETDEAFVNRQKAEAQKRVRDASTMTADAVNVAKSATEIAPVNVANWSVLASVYENLMGVTEGAEDWALQSYQKAVELEPGNPSLHTEIGKLYMAMSDKARPAADEKDEAVKAEAQKKSDELLSKAVDAFNKAVELKSDYAAAHFNLALALDRQGKLPEAISKMESVVRMNPQDVGVGFQLALLYFRNQEKDKAVRLMESVVKLSPNFSNARWYLAAMYEDAGNFDKAIAEIQKVKELNPDNQLVSKKLEDLEAKKSGGAPASDEELPLPVEQPMEDAGQPSVGR